MIAGESTARARLDVWLDIACLFKTRSAAQQACRAGKVDVNAPAGRAGLAKLASARGEDHGA